MLRNVLGHYLDTVSEREFDLPFFLLLPAMGFRDVHFTHGSVEFGKDFIAKRLEDTVLVQYSFQSKAGNITLSQWRSGIQTQLYDSILNPLAHPNFDDSLHRKSILVTTGDLAGNVKIEFGQFADSIENNFSGRSLGLWAKPQLLDMLGEYGLTGLYESSLSSFLESGGFFQTYGRALSGDITAKEIEQYSRSWLQLDKSSSSSLLRSAAESEIIAQQCLINGRVYEAIICRVSFMRYLFDHSYHNATNADIHIRSMSSISELSLWYVKSLSSMWIPNRDLLRMSFMEITTYLVQCARIMEIASVGYFAATTTSDKSDALAFLVDFVENEPGCRRPLSDRYAVSIVLACLALNTGGQSGTAVNLVRSAGVWLCDRYEVGIGLAPLEANEEVETVTLLGYAFDFIGSSDVSGSFLATALCDLAAFLGDSNLYQSLVNDIIACKIHPEYWQPSDTSGAIRVESSDVRQYPSVEFRDAELGLRSQDYASHMQAEPESFRFVSEFGPISAVMAMALLRDRYFPKIWHQLAM